MSFTCSSFTRAIMYPRCGRMKAIILRLVADLHSLLSVQCKVVWRDATLDKGYLRLPPFTGAQWVASKCSRSRFVLRINRQNGQIKSLSRFILTVECFRYQGAVKVRLKEFIFSKYGSISKNVEVLKGDLSFWHAGPSENGSLDHLEMVRRVLLRSVCVYIPRLSPAARALHISTLDQTNALNVLSVSSSLTSQTQPLTQPLGKKTSPRSNPAFACMHLALSPPVPLTSSCYTYFCTVMQETAHLPGM